MSFFQKRKLIQKLHKLFLALAVLLLLASVLFLAYLFFWFNKTPLISPLGKNKISQELSIEKKLAVYEIPFLSLRASESSYLIFLKENERIILSQNKDLDLQISSLQAILKQLTIEGKKFKEIDFRFEKPVISF